jgi:hypothetical protein
MVHNCYVPRVNVEWGGEVANSESKTRHGGYTFVGIRTPSISVTECAVQLWI